MGGTETGAYLRRVEGDGDLLVVAVGPHEGDLAVAVGLDELERRRGTGRDDLARHVRGSLVLELLAEHLVQALLAAVGGCGVME